MNQLMTVCCLIVASTNPLVSPAQTDSRSLPKTETSTQSTKVKAKVEKLGLGKDVTVRLLNTKEYHGSIKTIDDESFTIAEAELNQLLTIRYDEVRKVSSGYSLKSPGHSFSEHKRLIGTNHWSGDRGSCCDADQIET